MSTHRNASPGWRVPLVHWSVLLVNSEAGVNRMESTRKENSIHERNDFNHRPSGRTAVVTGEDPFGQSLCGQKRELGPRTNIDSASWPATPGCRNRNPVLRRVSFRSASSARRVGRVYANG